MTSTTDQMRTLLAQTVEAANYAATQAAAAAKSAAMISGLAPLASPVFTGNPTAPTPALGDNSASLATTAFIARQLGVADGIATLGADGKLTASQLPPISVTSVSLVASQAAMLALTGISIGAIAIRTDLGNQEYILTALPVSTLANWTAIGTSPVLSVAGLTGAIVASDLMTALAAAPLASPTFTGVPLAPTAADGTSTTQIATTAFVASGFAPKASPTFTGAPVAPTAVIDTNTGQIATTAFVLGQGSQSGDGLPAMDGSAARGTSTHFARADHIHPTDTSRAPIASPNFTGSPTAPTATLGDNSTLLATTAFVQANASGFTTGDVKPTLKTAADSGWVMLNDGTIGSASSGATTLASATTQALFTLLYAYSDANFPLQTSAGAATTRAAQGSAATAWANNCRMSLPKALGRALASAGAGSGLTSRTLGQTLGEETHVLTASEQASMSVSVSGSTSGSLSINSGADIGGGTPVVTTGTSSSFTPFAATGSLSVSATGTASGGGGAHNNMQPTLFVNWMVKL